MFPVDGCEMLLPFIEAGKAVFLVQHGDRATADEICPMANAGGDRLVKRLDLDVCALPAGSGAERFHVSSSGPVGRLGPLRRGRVVRGRSDAAVRERPMPATCSGEFLRPVSANLHRRNPDPTVGFLVD